MIPLKVLTLIVTGQNAPAVLVLEPIEEESHEGRSRIVPIWIGAQEAMQLGVAIEHVKLPRPMTHDLFLDAITNLDACVDHAIISDVKGNTFFAKLYLRQAGRLIQLDARPTDALALALREDAPFLIEEEVLDKASFPYIFNGDKEREVELQEFHSFLDTISPDDFSDIVNSSEKSSNESVSLKNENTNKSTSESSNKSGNTSENASENTNENDQE